MKGMKKTNGEFQSNNVCQIVNDVQPMSNMCTVPRGESKKGKIRYRKASRVSAKEIISICLMIFGLLTILFSFAELYFIDNFEYYSQYVFMSIDCTFGVFTAGFCFLLCGIRLAAAT